MVWRGGGVQRVKHGFFSGVCGISERFWRRQMNPQDMAHINVMVYPTTAARRKETYILFANPDE